MNSNKNKQSSAPAIDYKLHMAQQIEILNQNIELLKNNIFGSNQVELVIYGLSEGKTLEEAVEFSTEAIDVMNDMNAKRMEEKRKAFEEKLAAQQTQEK